MTRDWSSKIMVARALVSYAGQCSKPLVLGLPVRANADHALLTI